MRDARPTAVVGHPASDQRLGLTDADVDARRQAGQGNDYRSPTSRSYLDIVRDNSYPLINGPLLFVSGALVSFGAITGALMTDVPVFGNIAIGVVQGSRAKRQLDRVALLSEAPATVVREGSEQIVAILGVIAGTWTWAVVHIHRTRIVQRAIDTLMRPGATFDRSPFRRSS